MIINETEAKIVIDLCIGEAEELEQAIETNDGAMHRRELYSRLQAIETLGCRCLEYTRRMENNEGVIATAIEAPKKLWNKVPKIKLVARTEA